MAERVGFEPTVRRRITSFQDWLLKPLGHLSIENQSYHPAGRLSSGIYKHLDPGAAFMPPQGKRYRALSAKISFFTASIPTRMAPEVSSVMGMNIPAFSRS